MKPAKIVLAFGLIIFSLGLASFILELRNEQRLYAAEKMREFTKNNFRGLYDAEVDCDATTSGVTMVPCIARGKVYNQEGQGGASANGELNITIYARCPTASDVLNAHKVNACEHILQPSPTERPREYM